MLAKGFPSTGVPRTICDLAAVLPPEEVQHLIEWALTERRMTMPEFQACVRGYCRRGRSGSTLIRRLDFDLLSDEPFPTSVLERIGREVFTAPGLEGFVMQYAPPWHDGPMGIVDFAWPHLCVIVELTERPADVVTELHVFLAQRRRSAA